jgi:hypothetical protein
MPVIFAWGFDFWLWGLFLACSLLVKFKKSIDHSYIVPIISYILGMYVVYIYDIIIIKSYTAGL